MEGKATTRMPQGSVAVNISADDVFCVMMSMDCLFTAKIEKRRE